MTLLEEAEAAWLKHAKPRKRQIDKMLSVLNDVHGLPQLMMDHMRMSFIINYIRNHDRKDQTVDERSDRNDNPEATPETQT